MFVQGGSFFVLYSLDIVKTHNFWKELDCKILEIEQEKLVVSVCDFELHYIYSESEQVEKYKYITLNKTNYGNGVIFYLQTENLEIAKEKIIKAGGNLKSEIFVNHWGGEELLFEEPSGFKFVAYHINS